MAETRHSRETTQPKGLTRREPSTMARGSAGSFDLLNRFAEEMDRIFADFGFGRGLMPREFGELGRSAWSPEIEVFEREGQLMVHADLPGLKRDDVEVNITDNTLTIQGERRQDHEETREGYYRSERSYGSFYRSIPLPDGTDADKARATFRDGVLEISIPMPQRAERRRKIEIGEGGASETQPRAKRQVAGK